MKKYKLILSYDGTRFGGWQVQPNATSIQTLVQNALSTALRSPTDLTGAGRTDAGVHALAQTAHFITEIPFDPLKLHASLNGLLPPDIRVRSIAPAEDTFHARYSAKSKIYHYNLHLNQIPNPFDRLYSVHIPYPLDLPLLHQAANSFIGTHDFTSFANEAYRGSASRNAIRTLQRLDVRQEKDRIRLEFQADGFLYKMVRNITGTLLDIASGRIAPEKIPTILKAKDRRQAGASAPAHGLFLADVIY